VKKTRDAQEPLWQRLRKLRTDRNAEEREKVRLELLKEATLEFEEREQVNSAEESIKEELRKLGMDREYHQYCKYLEKVQIEHPPENMAENAALPVNHITDWSREPMIYLSCQENGVGFEMLVDTGARPSVLRRDLVKKLGWDTRIIPTQTQAVGAGNNPLQIKYQVTIPVKINGTFARGVSWNYEWTQCLENPMEVIPRGSGKRSIKRRRLDFMSGNVEVDDATKQTDGTYLITFLVAEELSVEAILGMRALTNMGALIDTVHGILVFGDQAYDYRNKSPKFRAASEVTIMPNHGARVKVNAINIEDGNYLVDDCIPLLNVGMEVESAWVSVEDGVAYLSINNSSPMPI
jgi:predicted aspartyl protease